MTKQSKKTDGQSAYQITWITNKEALAAHIGLVGQFFTLYEHPSNFPDENEREEPKFIKGRIERRPAQLTKADFDNHPDPFTHLICFELLETDKRKFVAGCVVEFYVDSACALITYIFVDKAYRGKQFGASKKKIGELLLRDDTEKGLPGLIRFFESKDGYNKQVNAVLFESNNPIRTDAANDSMPPAKRLKFFQSLGAKRIPFDYTQPPLAADSEPVDNLYLLCFPALTNLGLAISIEVVMAFLIELTKSLDKNKTDAPKKQYGFENYQHDREEIKKIGSGKEPTFAGMLANEKNIIQQMYKNLIDNRYANSYYLYLKEIPTLEEPKLYFKRASICIEILVDEDYYKPDSTGLCIANQHWVKDDLEEQAQGNWLTRLFGSQKVKEIIAEKEADESQSRQEATYCVINHSYETDLFAYKYQNNPPYYTKSYDLDTNDIIVRFPQAFEFTSEGRKETFYTLEGDCRDVPMKVYLSYTYFFKSSIRVWHVVLTSSDERPINEFDLIKLTKFFSGLQESQSNNEKVDMLNSITFRQSFRDEPTELIGFVFNKLGAINYIRRHEFADDSTVPSFISLKNICTGIIEIDFNSNYVILKATDGIIEKLPSVEEDPKSPIFMKLEELFEKLYEQVKERNVKTEEIFDETQYIFKALCGITLGIFDFRRMGYEEVDDTLRPRPASITESSFITINRGALTMYSMKDDVMESSWQTMGINPYLIYPSAVLAQNEYASVDAENRLNDILGQIRDRQTNHKISIEDLMSERDWVSDLLNDDYLSNVFQYKTEQDLYDYGTKHRGIEERVQEARAKLTQLDTIIDQRQNAQNIAYQRNIQILLAAVALLQIDGINEKIGSWIANHVAIFNADAWHGIVLGVELLMVLFLFTRWYRTGSGYYLWKAIGRGNKTKPQKQKPTK